MAYNGSGAKGPVEFAEKVLDVNLWPILVQWSVLQGALCRPRDGRARTHSEPGTLWNPRSGLRCEEHYPIVREGHRTSRITRVLPDRNYPIGEWVVPDVPLACQLRSRAGTGPGTD